MWDEKQRKFLWSVKIVWVTSIQIIQWTLQYESNKVLKSFNASVMIMKLILLGDHCKNTLKVIGKNGPRFNQGLWVMTKKYWAFLLICKHVCSILSRWCMREPSTFWRLCIYFFKTLWIIRLQIDGWSDYSVPIYSCKLPLYIDLVCIAEMFSLFRMVLVSQWFVNIWRAVSILKTFDCLEQCLISELDVTSEKQLWLWRD